MENDTQDIIKARYQQLPSEVQEAITAADLPASLERISKKYSLRVDQSGNLQVETLLIMLGLESADDFVDNVAKNLELSKDIASAITTDVNSDILRSIKINLMKIQAEEEKKETATTEKANNRDRANVLNTIENPASLAANPPINILAEEYPMVTTTVTPPNTPVKPTPSINLMDRLMTAPSATKTETVEKKAETSAIPTRPPGSDPYREPIE